MTFEQASARGLVWRREDDTRLTYLDGIRNHFRAALATVETAARGREKLLRDFLEFRRAAVRDGEQGPVRQYVLVPGADPDRGAAAGGPARWARGSRCGVDRGGAARRETASSRRGRSSCRSRSPRAGSRATCSTRASRWTRPS